MTVMASRSSTTARVSRKVRSAVGRWVDSTASTARANAMSVAMGTAQPPRFSGCPAARLTAMKIPAGTSMPPMAAAIGSAARPRITQIARDELALEFHPDHEEEDRQQPVGRPGREAEVQMQRFRSDHELREPVIGLRPRRIRPSQRQARRDQQQYPADRLLAQDLGEALRLGPGTAGQQAQAGGERPSRRGHVPAHPSSIAPREAMRVNKIGAGSGVRWGTAE